MSSGRGGWKDDLSPSFKATLRRHFENWEVDLLLGGMEEHRMVRPEISLDDFLGGLDFTPTDIARFRLRICAWYTKDLARITARIARYRKRDPRMTLTSFLFGEGLSIEMSDEIKTAIAQSKYDIS